MFSSKRWLQFALLFSLAIPLHAQTVVVLTTGTTWAVTANWNNASNKIEVIGGGGLGATTETRQTQAQAAAVERFSPST